MLLLVRVLFGTLSAGGSNPIKGDALVIAGATLYAVSNVSEVIYIYISLGWTTLTFISFALVFIYYSFFYSSSSCYT